jgi:hypothetical protein
MYRNSQSFFDGPMIRADARGKRCALDSKLARPITEAENFALKLDPNIVAFVPGLLIVGRPNAILAGIWTVVTESLKRIGFVWTWPHVGKKVFKLLPSFTNRYAPAHVTRIVGSVGIFAAPLHRLPNYIFRCSSAAMRAVRAFHFFSQATATAGVAVIEVRRLDKFLYPAIAATSPRRFLPIPYWRFVENKKSAESFTGKICERFIGHNALILH